MYNVVGNDGQVYGPVGTDTLVEWCKEGRIIARTNLMDPISGRVLRAEDLPELREILLPAPPPVAAEPPVITPTPVGTMQQPQQPMMPGTPQMAQLQMPQQQMPQQQMPTYLSATQINAYPPQPMQGYGPMAQGQLPLPGQSQEIYPQNQVPNQTPIVQVNNVIATYQPTYPVAYQAMPPKSKATALLLCFFFGPIGAHRFYLGHNVTGAIMAGGTVLSIGVGATVTVPWAFIDFILICVGALNDKQGRPLI